jgi:hypothetical protein
MCSAAVKSGDHTDWELGLCGGIRAEVVHDAFEIAGGDGDIGVVDEQIGMARVGGELDEVADLSVSSETGGAVDEADGMLGKLSLELFDGGRGGVVEWGNTEEQFVLAGVGLTAMATKGVDHGRVKAFERFKDGDARGKSWEWGAARGDEYQSCEDGGEEIAHAGNGEHRGEDLHGMG